MTRSQRSLAFTLIELLVVVAIIALLISILLPSLNHARAAARTVGCLSIQKQLGSANLMYAESQNEWYVQRDGMTTSQAPVGNFWGSNAMYRTLLGLRVGGSNNDPGSGETCTPGLVCPAKNPTSVIDGGWWRRSFAISGIGSPGIRKTGSVASDRAVFKPRVVIPASKVMGMDSVHWNINNTSDMDYGGNKWDARGDTDDANIRHGAYRHLEMTNMIFHDGHAETRSKQDTFNTVHNVRIALYDPYKFWGP